MHFHGNPTEDHIFMKTKGKSLKANPGKHTNNNRKIKYLVTELP